MIETVARALATEQMRRTLSAAGLEWAPGQDAFLQKYARLVIQAMREPTPEMVEAGLALAASVAPHDETGEVSIWHVWSGMIDAALQEPTP